jgi:hypothetical protein
VALPQSTKIVEHTMKETPGTCTLTHALHSCYILTLVEQWHVWLGYMHARMAWDMLALSIRGQGVVIKIGFGT